MQCYYGDTGGWRTPTPSTLTTPCTRRPQRTSCTSVETTARTDTPTHRYCHLATHQATQSLSYYLCRLHVSPGLEFIPFKFSYCVKINSISIKWNNGMNCPLFSYVELQSTWPQSCRCSAVANRKHVTVDYGITYEILHVVVFSVVWLCVYGYFLSPLTETDGEPGRRPGMTSRRRRTSGYEELYLKRDFLFEKVTNINRWRSF